MSCKVALLAGPAHVQALQQPLHLDFDAEFAVLRSSSVAASCRHCHVAAYLAVHFSALDYFSHAIWHTHIMFRKKAAALFVMNCKQKLDSSINTFNNLWESCIVWRMTTTVCPQVRNSVTAPLELSFVQTCCYFHKLSRSCNHGVCVPGNLYILPD